MSRQSEPQIPASVFGAADLGCSGSLSLAAEDAAPESSAEELATCGLDLASAEEALEVVADE